MPVYICPKCGSTENFDTLSHPANLTTEAVLCNKCGHIWLSGTVREED